MSQFHYQNQTLFAEQVAVNRIADAVGSPCYVYSRQALENHWQAFDEAFGTHPHLICYAVKANSNLAVLNVLAQQGAGFDIVSQGELERVLKAGGDAGKVVFSGVGKLPEEMRRALQVGVYCFNVESEAELETLNGVAGEMGKIAPVSLRVNPDVDAQTHPYISTGLKENKFGIDIDRAITVFERAAELPNIKVTGIDCHIGSQLTSVTPFMDALDRLLDRIDELGAKGIQLEHMDIGGGLGVRYRDEQPPTPGDYVSALLEKLGSRKIKILMEPGRAIAANAGIMLTRVLLLKSTEAKHFAVVDGAMNDLIRPSLYSAWQNIIPVTPRAGQTQSYDIVGPVCETGDFLGKDRELSIAPGDLLAICSAGAYGFVMSSNYNSRNRAAEVMVDGDAFYTVRRRETYEDQLALESLVP
ncbi:diaminopimelate decarboxylase [Ketobacter sp. MCCC 1A13808]|uniref:diaminopimelate decarboxylase n=1 Tax=Ketobacter sp. MCCC 1A13808 TaxID=2602738 RepID=UPI0012ECB039|nr:diaminopimelate decarboxylase [Ketobacter sp. MCCC 1A13808]MVF14043.1 diaminopimelate decarboxylase [Ketobacter sp. MCCC 1A13808]